MEKYTQITLDEWLQWKEDIRQKLTETANNFVYIGFRLKQIRDSGMFGGAADIFEFAQKEYGLSKSTVSRFIAINEKYSEGGNSQELREEFRNFSSSKLAEMLTLSDKEIELINERTTIKAIRELKKFDADNPEKVQEMETLADRACQPLEMCVIDFFREKQTELDKIMELMEQNEPDYKQAAEILVPSGQEFHRKGIVFIFLNGWQEGVNYKLMNSPDPVHMEWPEFLNLVYGIYSICTPGQVAREFYGELEKTEKRQGNPGSELVLVATSQQTEEKPVEKEPESAAGNEEAAEDLQEKAEKLTESPVGDFGNESEEESTENPEAIGKAQNETTEAVSNPAEEEPAEKPEDERLRVEQVERIKKEIEKRLQAIHTNMSFARDAVKMWGQIKMDLTGVVGIVQNLIRYLEATALVPSEKLDKLEGKE